jgi:hypothetical protein
MITFDPKVVEACRAAYAAGVATGGGWPYEEPNDDQLIAFLRWLRADYLESLETAQAAADPRVDIPQWLRDLDGEGRATAPAGRYGGRDG